MPAQKFNAVNQSNSETASSADVRNKFQEAWNRPQEAGNRTQWFEPYAEGFSEHQRQETTVLFGGLTTAQDLLLEGALKGLGYRVQHLAEADLDSFRIGKEFGNRGQCNPAYFTAGNLIKYLEQLHQSSGVPRDEIVKRYVFLTIDACGPCRYGAYITEYRKALRDAGFPGFRVVVMHKQGVNVTMENPGIALNAKFIVRILRAVLVGDALNAMGYRIRAYETEQGATDRALARCKEVLYDAFSEGKSVLLAARRCRKIFAGVKVDRSQVKPKVSVIGEFWATTTEGDGNYHIQRFLEQEGAEVEAQPVAIWVLYTIWTSHDRYIHYSRVHRDAQPGAGADRTDAGNSSAGRVRAARVWGKVRARAQSFVLNRLFSAAEWAVHAGFQTYAKALGLNDYQLPDMDEMAQVAHEFYNSQLRGGEGHMEVAKVILNTTKKKSTMTLSVKPFGCMPSSAVSDGIQSLVVDRFPDALFLPIETTGDGIVNVHSRVQMILHKAKQRAYKEYETALAHTGLDKDAVEKLRSHPRLQDPLRYPKHQVACTAANEIYGLKHPLSS